jgi:hypothetical protein
MAKRPVRNREVAKRAGNPLAAQALGPLGALLGVMPGQVRLSAREQQPRPSAFIPPKGNRRGGRGR